MSRAPHWNTPKPCADCGGPAYGVRCRRCYARSKPPPLPRRADLDDNREKKRRRDAVRAHVDAYGLVCPGWRRPAHPVAAARLLHADHPAEVSLGGAARPEQFAVLCASCNSAKSNTRRSQASKSRAIVTPDRQW